MHSYTQDHNWIYKAWEKTVEMDVLCSPPTLPCRAQGYSLALTSVNLVHLNSLTDESSGWESACPVGLERAENKNRDLKCWLYQVAYVFRSLILFFPASPVNHRKLLPQTPRLAIPPQNVFTSGREEETWNKIWIFLWPAADRTRCVHSDISAAQMCCWMSLLHDWQTGTFPMTSCAFL